MSEQDRLARLVRRAVREGVARAMRGLPRDYEAEFGGSDGQGKEWVTLAGESAPRPVRSRSCAARPGERVRVSKRGNSLHVTGNLSDPSAGARSVEEAGETARVARKTAEEARDYAVEAAASAVKASDAAQLTAESAESARVTALSAAESANRARATADAVEEVAVAARETAEGVEAIAVEAKETADGIAETAGRAAGDAESARASAEGALASARAASFGLADVERVVGTLGRIARSGRYVSQAGEAFDPAATYYVRDPSGERVDAEGNRYTLVAEPDGSAVGGYYRLVVDESIAQYLASHLWEDDYGLNLAVESAGGYRLHEGTVDGSRPMGLYILDDSGGVALTLNAGGGQVGKSGESHMELDYHSFRLVDGEDDPNTYAWMSDLRPAGGTIFVRDEFSGSDAIVCPGATVGLRYDTVSELYLTHPADVNTASVELNGEELESTRDAWIVYGGEDFGTISVILPFALDPADSVVVRYLSSSAANKAYTLGIRDGEAGVAAMSFAEGHGTAASGIMAHAEGYQASASGAHSHAEGAGTRAAAYASHAEGAHTVASGGRSHAEGSGATASGEHSHAEGAHTVASGERSHAEGACTVASGAHSHAQGSWTVAASASQTALGKHNVEDAEGRYAVIVGNGNGTASNSRSNAATLDWDGNAALAGGLSLHGKEALPVYEVPAAWSGNGAAFAALLPARPCVALSTDGYELWFDADASTDSY